MGHHDRRLVFVFPVYRVPVGTEVASWIGVYFNRIYRCEKIDDILVSYWHGSSALISLPLPPHRAFIGDI